MMICAAAIYGSIPQSTPTQAVKIARARRPCSAAPISHKRNKADFVSIIQPPFYKL